MTAVTTLILAVPAAQADTLRAQNPAGKAGARVVDEVSRQALRDADSGSAVALRKPATSCPPGSKPSDKGCIPRSAAYVDRRERCLSARVAVAFYRGLTWTRQLERGGLLGDRTPVVRGRSCRWARFAASVHRARAQAAAVALAIWKRTRTLRDPAFCDGCRAWHRAVEIVQRVFPGTSGWLLSCSAAEGGHGRWVGYGGVGYSAWLRDSDTVGGPLQFRFSTFTGMFRRGAEYARAKGFIVPSHLQDRTTAWRSALGQALAGGWARYTGNDDAHWSASWGRGC